MRFQRVLVTGAGGLLGRYVVDELHGHCEVSGLDLVPAADGVRHVLGSIEDPATVARACAGVDAVLHIAARPNIWSGHGD
jgi:UDP-glucose 4-epimerase